MAKSKKKRFEEIMARVADAAEELRALASEYEEWADALPENLIDTRGEDLRAVGEEISAIADNVEEAASQDDVSWP